MKNMKIFIQVICHCFVMIVFIAGISSNVSGTEFNGYFEVLSGFRLKEDPYEQDISVMEKRLQLEYQTYVGLFDLKYKGDVCIDWVIEEVAYDQREIWFFTRPTDYLDIKVGRQVLTWGTGDLVFLNDLFPKDWQSFFIGRNPEYLKAPSDAAKLSWFSDVVNIDLVYTPQFDPDRYITGEYVSHWNAALKKISGYDEDEIIYTPDDYFDDHEIAVRIYKNINSYECALYGYWGFWKTPSYDAISSTKIYPGLDVYGGSIRGNVLNGIGNIEFAYYHSKDERDESNPSIKNSSVRYLIGYTQDIAKDFNVSVQYFIEKMLSYEEYEKNVSKIKADEHRHLLTMQMTKLLMNQNLEISFPMYYSPSDNDAYLRPRISYKYSDNVSFVIGNNIFLGDKLYTFFGQLQNNTNAYTSFHINF